MALSKPVTQITTEKPPPFRVSQMLVSILDLDSLFACDFEMTDDG